MSNLPRVPYKIALPEKTDPKPEMPKVGLWSAVILGIAFVSLYLSWSLFPPPVAVGAALGWVFGLLVTLEILGRISRRFQTRLDSWEQNEALNRAAIQEVEEAGRNSWFPVLQAYRKGGLVVIIFLNGVEVEKVEIEGRNLRYTSGMQGRVRFQDLTYEACRDDSPVGAEVWWGNEAVLSAPVEPAGLGSDLEEMERMARRLSCLVDQELSRSLEGGRGRLRLQKVG